MDEQRRTDRRQTRRAAFVLAALLAATTLTGGAAITGLTRHSSPSATAPIVQQMPASQLPTPASWEGDD
jgi:hypothetical protein